MVLNWSGSFRQKTKRIKWKFELGKTNQFPLRKALKLWALWHISTSTDSQPWWTTFERAECRWPTSLDSRWCFASTSTRLFSASRIYLRKFHFHDAYKPFNISNGGSWTKRLASDWVTSSPFGLKTTTLIWPASYFAQNFTFVYILPFSGCWHGLILRKWGPGATPG